MSTGGPTWLLRNLGNLSRLGLLAPQHPEIVAEVVARLTDAHALRRGRIHPLDALRAQLVYAQGRSVRGHHVWTSVLAVINALQPAFSLAFWAVRPSGGRHLLALDVPGSVDSGTVGGMPGLTPRLATAAMSLVNARTEAQTTSVAFTAGTSGSGGRWGGGTPGLTPLTVSPAQRLDDVVRAMRALPMGGSDCAPPMLWAAQQRVPVDTFVLYTDNETWAGQDHPSVAQEQDRQRMGTGARLVVGMTATPSSVADPNDRGMLDVVGFGAAAPNLIGAFARGEL